HRGPVPGPVPQHRAAYPGQPHGPGPGRVPVPARRPCAAPRARRRLARGGQGLPRAAARARPSRTRGRAVRARAGGRRRGGRPAARAGPLARHRGPRTLPRLAPLRRRTPRDARGNTVRPPVDPAGRREAERDPGGDGARHARRRLRRGRHPGAAGPGTLRRARAAARRCRARGRDPRPAPGLRAPARARRGGAPPRRAAAGPLAQRPPAHGPPGLREARHMLVPFSGLDGAGKSTVIGDLVAVLQEEERRCAVLHMNDDVGTYAYLRRLRDALLRRAVAGGLHRTPHKDGAQRVEVGPARSAARRVRNALLWSRTLRRLIYPLDVLIFLAYRLYHEGMRGRVLIM